MGRKKIEVELKPLCYCRKRIAEENAWIINVVAKKLKKRFRDVDFSDIVGTATDYYLKYVQSYDSSRGMRFDVYIYNWLESRIVRALLFEVGFRRVRVGTKEVYERERYMVPIMDEGFDIEQTRRGEAVLYDEALTIEDFSREISDRVAVREALKVLDSREAQVYRLYYALEYCQDDIARMLNLSQMQVSRILKSIRNKVKQKLEDVCLA